MSVALPGIVGGAPALPYAFSGGIVSRRLPPTAMPSHPMSQPRITSPVPRRNGKGFLVQASKVFPLGSLPT